jgi:predicted O-linked N-acetylglucosamine transferase (SPINDLY family)
MNGKIKGNDRRIETLLDQGIHLHQAGHLMQAKAHYEAILALNPRHFDALHLLGIVAAQTQNPQEAERLISRALQVNPYAAIAQANHGNTLLELGRPQEALVSYDKAIALAPDHGQAFNHRGQALQALGRLEDALASYDRAIALNPDDAEALHKRGACLQDLGRREEALSSYERALALRPETLNNRGTCLEELGRVDEALRSYEQALSLRPEYAEALNNRGNLLQHFQQFEAALSAYDAAIAAAPAFLAAHLNRANALQRLMRLEETLPIYDRILAITPHDAAAHYNRGNALYGLRRYPEALESYDRAIAIKPDYAEAFFTRGKVLQELRQLQAAVACFEKAVELRPHQDFWPGTAWHLRMQVCQWQGFETWIQSMRVAIQDDRRVIYPFDLLGMLDAPEVHLKAAQLYASRFPSRPPFEFSPSQPSTKIKVGYFSADFHNHATTYLMAELFEAHDPSRFEIYGFSFGPNQNDEMRQRISAQFHRFMDVSRQSDRQVASLSRELGIDIAVDLKGYTRGSRTEVFVERCAPIQVSYLGYPGTSGGACFDYVIADQVVVPPEARDYFSEKVIYLPHSYQVNDSKREISPQVITRQEAGLPESGFVFCCFNNNYKITPSMFDSWVRILNAVQGSVLWLLEDNPIAATNLREEARARGLDPARLVFAPRMALPDHLARHRLADLFLDTLPYNAHTTASDALWAGLPVITCMGQSFPARVAASLLSAMNLNDLIAGSLEDYESLAIDLAANPRRLQSVRDRVEQGRKTSPLFDGTRFARHLEAAFSEIYNRHAAGQAPAHIQLD